MTSPFLIDFKVIPKGETHFIPNNFLDLRNNQEPSLVMGYVPDTNEILHFMPLSTDQINSLVNIVSEFDYNLYSRLGGVFMTIDLKTDGYFFMENMPRLYEILYDFFQEVDEKGLNLFDVNKMLRMLNLD